MLISHRIFIPYRPLLVHFMAFDVIELHFGLEGHIHEGEPMKHRCRSALEYIMM